MLPSTAKSMGGRSRTKRTKRISKMYGACGRLRSVALSLLYVHTGAGLVFLIGTCEQVRLWADGTACSLKKDFCGPASC